MSLFDFTIEQEQVSDEVKHTLQQKRNLLEGLQEQNLKNSFQPGHFILCENLNSQIQISVQSHIL